MHVIFQLESIVFFFYLVIRLKTMWLADAFLTFFFFSSKMIRLRIFCFVTTRSVQNLS